MVLCRARRAQRRGLKTALTLKRQDNDVVILRDVSAVRVCDERFEPIWAAANPLPDSDNPLARSARATNPKAGDAAPRCAIKGNISRNGEHIYHVPGDQTYDRVQMDKGRNKRRFCTEEQAVAAGWRKAGTW